MRLPVSFLWSLLCPADKTLLVLGLNFICHLLESPFGRVPMDVLLCAGTLGSSTTTRGMGSLQQPVPALPLPWVRCSLGPRRLLWVQLPGGCVSVPRQRCGRAEGAAEATEPCFVQEGHVLVLGRVLCAGGGPVLGSADGVCAPRADW